VWDGDAFVGCDGTDTAEAHQVACLCCLHVMAPCFAVSCFVCLNTLMFNVVVYHSFYTFVVLVVVTLCSGLSASALPCSGTARMCLQVCNVVPFTC
jgi:hypothetical protein